MNEPVELTALPKHIGIIAGRGVYPAELVAAARLEGVERITVVGYKGETRRSLAAQVDDFEWLNVGQMTRTMELFERFGVSDVVMAGQIAPRNIFRLRPDKALLKLLSGLETKNAHTIFGGICDYFTGHGLRMLSASLFMGPNMPAKGLICGAEPTESQKADIELGLRVIRDTSGLEIGQTVVIKDGVILAVEAWEGTDAAIVRGGKLGHSDAVVVKVAKQGHDMRFDIPVIGMRTIRSLKKGRIGCLAIEAERTIILERKRLDQEMQRLGITFLAVEKPED